MASELPRRLAARLADCSDSAAIKAAVREAYEACDAALIAEAEARGWGGGCGVGTRTALLPPPRPAPAAPHPGRPFTPPPPRCQASSSSTRDIHICAVRPPPRRHVPHAAARVPRQPGRRARLCLLQAGRPGGARGAAGQAALRRRREGEGAARKGGRHRERRTCLWAPRLALARRRRGQAGRAGRAAPHAGRVLLRHQRRAALCAPSAAPCRDAPRCREAPRGAERRREAPRGAVCVWRRPRPAADRGRRALSPQVLLGSSGAWKGGAAAGETAVQKLSAELARMDARRNEIAVMAHARGGFPAPPPLTLAAPRPTRHRRRCSRTTPASPCWLRGG